MSHKPVSAFKPGAAACGLLLVLLPAWAAGAPAARHSLRSPDGRIEIVIRLEERLRYDVSLRERPLLAGATLGMDVDHRLLGREPQLLKAQPSQVDRELEPPVHQKSARLRERYNQLRLELRGGYAVSFRAYDEGIAYRFETALGPRPVTVYSEEVGLAFAGAERAYFPKEDGFQSHNERHFLPLAFQEIGPEALASVPVVVEAPGGVKLAIADADIDDYPGLWFKGTGGSALAGTFPPYPLEEKLEHDRDLRVVKAADYIAVTAGTRTFPWRVVGIAERDGDLLTNAMVYLLGKPSQLADTSWIRPGKVAWDWWNGCSLHGVDFKSGVNTRTYQAFIDFAARYQLEYVILDEGWYPLGNLLQVVPDIDMEALTAYARQKNVGIILWVVWKTLDDQLEPALERFDKWGIKGLKVDFMQRDDQKVMQFYQKVAREAARHKLLLDFHGAIRPATLTRTWPNVLTTEGVLGLEQSKWSTKSDPEHDVTIPFTRMFVGPMDYTPGAMVNGSKKNFAPVFEQPMSMGTRCHQLGMYVVYESPLEMLADSPSNYLEQPDAMSFLGPVPSVWDETRVLDARLGDYVLVARRRGSDWYVGAMTDWTARELDLDLAFLPPGRFELDAFEDGPNAGRYGSDYRRVKSAVTRETRLKLRLAEGGGWAGRLSPRD